MNRLTSDQKYNFVSCLIDSAGWTFGMAFFSLSTIVPAFLSQLGASNILIGILPAIITLGYTTPGVFFATHVGRLPQVRPRLFRVALLERIPLVLMGLAALCITDHRTLLWTFLLLFTVHSVTLGTNQPGYWVAISKSIPELWRGRLFGFAGLAGGLCSFAVLPIASKFLNASGQHLIRGFAKCFIVGGLIEFITVIPLGFLREPITPPTDSAGPERFSLDFFGAVWSTSQGFRRFVWSQTFFSIWMIAGPFYLLDGVQRLHVTGQELGLYTTIAAVVAAFGGSLCGMLSDRSGNRVVLLIASASGCAASVYALFVTNSLELTIVFAGSAFASAGVGLAGYNICMEFAPTDPDIPHYTAFYNLMLAPLRALSLIAGGVISQRFNFAPVYIISASAAAVCVLLTLRLIEPRHAKQGFISPEHVV